MTVASFTIGQQVLSTLNRVRAHAVCPNQAHYILTNPEQLLSPQQESP